MEGAIDAEGPNDGTSEGAIDGALVVPLILMRVVPSLAALNDSMKVVVIDTLKNRIPATV